MNVMKTGFTSISRAFLRRRSSAVDVPEDLGGTSGPVNYCIPSCSSIKQDPGCLGSRDTIQPCLYQGMTSPSGCSQVMSSAKSYERF